ncbi:MAG: D-alanine--D-alanine ligase [Gammaproteobacteria bacterium]
MPEQLSPQPAYVAPGMPPLDLSGRSTSFFEFWPTWLMYIPVVLQWLLLSIRYGSLSLPLIANPSVPLSGMVGAAKSTVFNRAGPRARQWILPWLVLPTDERPVAALLAEAERQMAGAALQYPLVAKPDFGCRGAGVKLIADGDALAAYIESFPRGAAIQLQQLCNWEAEAGVFYVRYPDQARGEITSLTLKYTPFVVGDGERSLGELVRADPRAGELLHLYFERHGDRWDEVIAAGEPYRLVFSASHCRGAVFRDASHLITAELREVLDHIFDDIEAYYYGRLDIKFKDIASLQAGRDFAIIEINGASSESINIWDRNMTIGAAMNTLLQQYHTLFKLGSANRKRGHRTPGLGALYQAWRYERQLVRQYPKND